MLEILFLVALLALMGWSAWLDVIWLALVAVALYLAGSWLFADLEHLAFLVDPLTALSLAAFSLTAGAIWSLWKWRRWVRSPHVQKAIIAGHNKWQNSESAGAFMDSAFFPDDARASENVQRIITWITLWPFSMIVYFFEDFLSDIGRWIYERLGQVYVRITEAALPPGTR